MTRRHVIAMFIIVNSAAAVAFWAAVAVVGANSVYSVVLFAPFSMLFAKIASRKWPVAEMPWTPWKSIRQPRDTSDDVDPEISGLLRFVNIGYLAVTGLMLVVVVKEILRSVMATSP